MATYETARRQSPVLPEGITPVELNAPSETGIEATLMSSLLATRLATATRGALANGLAASRLQLATTLANDLTPGSTSGSTARDAESTTPKFYRASNGSWIPERDWIQVLSA